MKGTAARAPEGMRDRAGDRRQERPGRDAHAGNRFQQRPRVGMFRLMEDLLDRAWGLEPQSRLSCQAILAQSDLTVEIPKYSINHAKENH